MGECHELFVLFVDRVIRDFPFFLCGLCASAVIRFEGRCVKKDDFQGLRDKINAADALIFSTPMYFGGLSESAKCFLDRWRRCEVKDREGSPLRGKRAMGISAAGGSGGGAVKALRDLEEYLRWLQFTIFDLEPVIRRNADYKLRMLEVAGRNLAGKGGGI